MAVTGSASADYVNRLPAGLRRSLFAGRWLPVIGAGISRNARTDDGRRPPNWSELGDLLAVDVPTTSRGNPVDAISSYADLYGRAALVERLTELLLVNEVEPSEVHAALARLPFDMVVTTNADFLLEAAYQQQRRACEPILGESQLSLALRPATTGLLKFHGDLRHPEELIMTEADYDGFLRRRPLLATYLSWWLLTRETVLFGYSLDDGDLRELLGVIRDRLGGLSRGAWAVLPADPDGAAVRFARRGLRPVILSDDPGADRGAVLVQFFEGLRAEWERHLLPQLTSTTESATAELRRG